jgi:AcrR family transcriptional regulator
MNWKRARSPAKIEERRQAIIDAAKKLFRKQRYDQISLNIIAEEAGFTKSNVYRYFASREEIFLTIYADLLRQWSDDILSFYGTLPKLASYEVFADGFSKLTQTHKDMLSLCSVFFVSLERNSSVEQLREFKKFTLDICINHYIKIKLIYPKLTQDDVVLLLKLNYSAMATLWCSSQSNKVFKKLNKEKEFQLVATDFGEDLKKAIVVYLRGIVEK